MALIDILEPEPGSRAAVQLEAVRQTRGYASNFHRALAPIPDALPAFEEMSRAIRSTFLSDQLRELIILRVSVNLQNDYEWKRHSLSARETGLSDQQIRDVGSWQESTAYDHVARKLLSLVDAHLSGSPTDDQISWLVDRLGSQKTTSACLIIGWYLFVSAVIQPLRIGDDDTHQGSGIRMPQLGPAETR